MALISIGTINKKIIIPILGGLIKLVYRIMKDLNPKKEILNKNPFLVSIYISLGMTLSFIPYLILKYKSKKLIRNKNDYISPIKAKKNKLILKYEYYDIYERTKWNKFKLILISTIFDFSQTIIVCAFCIECVYNLWVFDIIFISLFSYLLLKSKLYKHQYFSMIIIVILGFGLNIIEYFKKDVTNESKINIIEILAKFISEIFFSLNIVLNKLNMEKNFCTSYEICIWEGFINLILFVIILFIINKIGISISDIKYPDNFFEYFNRFDINDFILSLVVIFISCFYNIFILVTYENFTPCHVLIILIINESYYYVKINNNFLLNIIGFFLLLIMLFIFLVFIEIIEFNFFEFSINTKKNIGIRADSDLSENFFSNELSLNIIETNNEINDNEEENIFN